MCKTLLLIFFVNVFVLNCRAGMNTKNPYIDPVNPSFSGNITVGGTVDGVNVSALGQSTGTFQSDIDANELASGNATNYLYIQLKSTSGALTTETADRITADNLIMANTSQFMIKESTYPIYATSVKFPDGTVQVSSPTAGGGGSGSDETALIRSTYNATGKFRQLFFAGGATLPSGDNAGTYEGALIQKNEYQVNNSSRPIYSIVYTSYTERFAYWEQVMDDNFDNAKDINLYINFYSAITSSSVLFNVQIATMTNPSIRTWTSYQATTTGVGGSAYDIVTATITWTSNSTGFIAGREYGICVSRENDTVDALGDIYVTILKLVGWKKE